MHRLEVIVVAQDLIDSVIKASACLLELVRNLAKLRRINRQVLSPLGVTICGEITLDVGKTRHLLEGHQFLHIDPHVLEVLQYFEILVVFVHLLDIVLGGFLFLDFVIVWQHRSSSNLFRERLLEGFYLDLHMLDLECLLVDFLSPVILFERIEFVG